MVTAVVDSPHGYGRIVRAGERDCTHCRGAATPPRPNGRSARSTPASTPSRSTGCSTRCADRAGKRAGRVLPARSRRASTGSAGCGVETFTVADADEIRGINSRSELAAVSRIVRQTKNAGADGRRRDDRGSGHDLHRSATSRSAPTRSFIPACRSKGARRSARAAKSTAASASSIRTIGDRVTVLNHCVITELDDRERRVGRTVRAPAARQRTSRERAQVGNSSS